MLKKLLFLLLVFGPGCLLAQTIKITEFKVLYPDESSFRIICKAIGNGIEVGSYRLRTQEKVEEDQVPPGFYWEGYAIIKEVDIIGAGDTDNGEFDEDKREGVYARTFSTEDWKPGTYTFLFSAHNRPGTGPYIYDRRTFSIEVTKGGKIKMPDKVNVDGKNIIIYKKEDVYASFPSLLKLEVETLVTTFGAGAIRSHIDPTAGSRQMISYDGGLTWEETRKKFANPKYRTPEGTFVRARATSWQYVPDSQRESLQVEQRMIRDLGKGTIAYLSPDCYQSISNDNGITWKTETIKTPEYIAGLMHFLEECSYIVTSKGIRLVASYGKRKGINLWEVFFLRSQDNGKTWQFIPMLSSAPEKIGFSETAIVETSDGNVLAIIRSDPEGNLWQSFSKDAGLTWSAPEKTPMWGHPAHLLKFPDGKILCTYGYRTPPMGIRACLSIDNGKSWQIDKEFILRADGNTTDLGYPISALLSDGSIFTIYYFTSDEGITHIAGTKWRIAK